MRLPLTRLALFATLAAGSAGLARAQVIDTFPQEYDFTAQADQTRNDVAVGENFFVPAGFARLTSLTLGVWGYDLRGFGPADQIQLRTYLYAWDGTRPTGPALYQSAIFSPPAIMSFVFRTFTPNVTLTPGGQYAFFVSGIGLAQPAATPTYYGLAQRGTLPIDAYPDGIRVNANTASFADIGTTTWYKTYGRDIAFRAEFAAAPVATVPEPGTWALTAAGLLGVAGVGARRRLG